MAQFVLVHGGLHGARCWELLQAELEQLGHVTVAMDLPIDRPGAFMDDYADVVVASLAGLDVSGAYLVGHSMGGMVVPRVAARLPGTRIIFLCAGFAHTDEEERREGAEATTADFFGWLVFDDHGRVTMPRAQAIAAFYHDVPPDVADWAVAQLRPQWAEGFSNVGSVAPYADRVAHVICTADDRIIDAGRHRAMSEARFGITPIALPGGHSPFLSHPALLARILTEVAAADAAGFRHGVNS